MIEFPILSTIIFTPLIGALLIYILGVSNINFGEKFYKAMALVVTLITLVLSLVMWSHFDPSISSYQFLEKETWINNYEIYYALGVDGISLLFVILTAVTFPVCILSSWSSIKKSGKNFVISFLLMETFVMGSFLALDAFLFYVFFEAVLIPMYLIIGIWGGQNRIYAAYKFFLYTLAGSVFLLVGIVFIYFQANTSFIPELAEVVPAYSMKVQQFLWLAFFASFAVKMPMWPVHTWLPDAHVQAPTAGSVVLAGVLLKLGGYGFLRFSLPLFPLASHYFADFVIILSIIAVIYTSLVALMQDDMKKLIAYSSVAHMGYVTAGIFTFGIAGVEGAIFQMISHGIVSAALFLCVGVLYDRMHTKEIDFYGGLTSKMPKFALQFMVFMLASSALPGTAGFIGEIVVLLGVFKMNKLYGALMATGIFLGAAYMLWLYARVMFGQVKNKKLNSITDLTFVEKAKFWPLATLVIVLGIFPNILLSPIHSSVSTLSEKISIYKSDMNTSTTKNITE